MTEHKIPAVGTKAMVFHGTAKHTVSGLTKKDLMKTKKGRIVSRKQHALGLKRIKHLFALGYKPTKGKFTVMRKSMVDGRRKTHKKRSTRRRGGAAGVPHGVSGTGKMPGSV